MANFCSTELQCASSITLCNALQLNAVKCLCGMMIDHTVDNYAIDHQSHTLCIAKKFQKSILHHQKLSDVQLILCTLKIVISKNL